MRFSLALLGTALLAGVSTAERRTCATFYGGGEYKTLSSSCGGWFATWGCDQTTWYMGKRYTRNREWTHVKVAAGAELHFVTGAAISTHWRKYLADKNWHVNDGWYKYSKKLNEVYCFFKNGDFTLERAATIYSGRNRGGARRHIYNECDNSSWLHKYCSSTYETQPSAGYGDLVYGSPKYWRNAASSIQVYGGWRCEMSRFLPWPLENWVNDASSDVLNGSRWWNFHSDLNNNLAEVYCFKNNVRRRAEAGEAGTTTGPLNHEGPESHARIQIIRGEGASELTEREAGVFVAPDDWEEQPAITIQEEKDAKELALDAYVTGTFPELEAQIAQEKAALAEERALRAPDAESSDAEEQKPNPLTSRLASAESKSEEARQG